MSIARYPIVLPGKLASSHEGRSVAGLRFSVEEWTDGSDNESIDLVAMHGMGGSPSNWNLVAPRLSNVRLTRIEMPLHEGYCARSSLGGPANAEDLAQIVASTVDQLCESPVHIVAHSMGAFFAVRCATVLSEKVRGVVSLSGSMFSLSESLLTGDVQGCSRQELRRMRVNFAGAVVMTLIPPYWPLRKMLDVIRPSRIGLHPFLNRSVVSLPDPIGDCFAGQGGIAALKVTDAARRGASIRDAFAECTVPIWALVGGKDPLLTSCDYEELHKYVVGGTYVTVPTAGHWPHIEAPSDVAMLIRHVVRGA